MIPPEFRREGWYDRVTWVLMAVGGRKKNQRNPTARIPVMTMVMFVVLGLGFIDDGVDR